MELNRRDFVVLAAVTCAGCKGQGGDPGNSQPLVARTVDAGPIAQFATPGVYGEFRDQGFFLISEGGTISAISSICTHRDCKLKPVADHTFFCNCHGSRFDPAGKVTKGPATRDLPHYATTVSAQQRLLVEVRRPQFDSE